MNQIDMPDERIAERLRSDTQFLGVIIDRYEAKLAAFVRRKSSASPDDVKDILQNVFIKVYRNINDYDTSMPFSSWIYRIARNEMIDWYRKEKRTPRVSLEASEQLLASIASESNVEGDVDQKQFQEMFAEAVEKLPDKYRDVVVLRYLEEKSYDEIADIMTLPPGTVAIRLSRAKALLQNTLSHYGKH